MRRLLTRAALAAVAAALLYPAAALAQEETPTAKATRKKLEKAISVDFNDTRMEDAMKEIKSEFDNRLGIKIDSASGVSINSKVTYKAEEKPLKKILDEFCTKYDIGYIVLSRPGDRYDGWIIIRKSGERGYEKGKEPKSP
jgi:hypothetical protein